MSAPLILDDGLQFGLGVFETIAAEHGHGVLLESHLPGLARSAQALGLGELAERGVTHEAVSGYIREHWSAPQRLQADFDPGEPGPGNTAPTPMGRSGMTGGSSWTSAPWCATTPLPWCATRP